IGEHLKHSFVPLEPFLVSMQQAYPIHYLMYNTRVSSDFGPFRCIVGPMARMEYLGAFDVFLCSA
ncbi:hypothetical protein, partial [Klebsiella pneumoniae]|uniref:hypothetical protein n=1 Tax=Klebsiella pneumoniae TaxID=573 RepID=UPI0024DE75A0